MRSNKIWTLLMALILCGLPLAAQEDEEEEEDSAAEIPSGVDGHLMLNNAGNEMWRVVDTGGDGVYIGSNMSTVYLDVGQEYYIDLSEVDSERYPLDIKSHSGEVLISQREDIETTAGEEVNASVEEDGIRFVLTEELAKEISMFRAAPYPQMVGFFSVQLEDEGTEEEDDEEEDEEEE
ncbi:MAG: hypothetical protein R6V67_06425 [Spirochaetia bacterium]